MSEYDIDEKHLNKLAGAIEHLVDHINDETKTMLNKDEDIFIRYMAYTRMIAFMQSYSAVVQVAKNAFRFGHDTMNETLHTKAFKKKGWGKKDLSDNPFFGGESDDGDDCDDDEEHNHENCIGIRGSDLPEEARDMLAKVLMSALKSRSKGK